jgi:hypothetical protein
VTSPGGDWWVRIARFKDKAGEVHGWQQFFSI